MAMITYTIDGHNFMDYGVYVSGSKGLTDLPKAKQGLSVDWQEQDGQYTDLARRTYQPREITLECFMCATGHLDFVAKCDEFVTLFSKPHLSYLQVILDETQPATGLLHFMIYINSVEFSKKWNEEKMVGTFSLKLIEPQPRKIVIHNTHYGTGGLSVEFETQRLCRYCVIGNTDGAITITWTNNVISTIATPTVEVQLTADDQYLLIYGNPEDIENLTTT